MNLIHKYPSDITNKEIRTFLHLIKGSGYPLGVHSIEPLPPEGIDKRFTDTVILEASAGLGGEVTMTISVTGIGSTFDDMARHM